MGALAAALLAAAADEELDDADALYESDEE